MANILDKAIAAISPEKGYRRAVARSALSIMNNGTGYGNYGASRVSRAMRSWHVGGGSAKEDIEDNLDTLRKRSRDAYMGIPLATGAIKTLRTNVVGSGLVPTPQVDADYLHLTEEQADQLQAQISREFELWADSTLCDAGGMDNFWRLQTLAFTSFLMNGLCEVTYPDRDDTVTEMVPFLSNREYRMPEVEDLVVVLHPGDSPEDAVVLGTIWNEKIKPAEGKEKIYRKEYCNEDGKAYRKFDANAKELLDFVDGKKILKAKSLEVKIGSATVTISEGGDVKITSPASITVQAASELKLTATTLTASAATVNITGGGGDVVVSGKSLVNHIHTGNMGKPTTPPL